MLKTWEFEPEVPEQEDKPTDTNVRDYLHGYDLSDERLKEMEDWRDVESPTARAMRARLEGGRAADYQTRKREGFLESALIKGITKLVGGEHEFLGTRDVREIQETGELDALALRQTEVSNRELMELLVDHARQQLGDPAAEAVEETWDLTGYKLGDKGPVEAAWDSIQKGVDATIPFYLATGLRRRIFENTVYEMPSSFRFGEGMEAALEEAITRAEQTGEGVKLGMEQGFFSSFRVTPDMDQGAAREIAWNNQLAYLRANVAEQVQNGTFEDVSLLVSTIATLGAAGAIKTAGSGAGVGYRTLRAVDIATTTPTLGGAARLAAKLGGGNSQFVQTAKQMTTAMTKAIPVRARPFVDLTGRTLDQATTFALMGALSKKDMEGYGAATGFGLGVVLTGGLGLPGALRGAIMPSGGAINMGNRVQREAVTGVNEALSRKMAEAKEVLGDVGDVKILNYAMRDALKDPAIAMQVEQLHDLVNPTLTVEGRIHRIALQEISSGFAKRKAELQGIETGAAKAELGRISKIEKVLRDRRAEVYSAANASTPKFLERVREVEPQIYNAIKRQLQEATYLKEDYLSAFMAKSLSSTFAAGRVNMDLAVNPIPELGISDSLYKGLREAMSPGKMTSVDEAQKSFQLTVEKLNTSAEQFGQDLLSLGYKTAEAETIVKSIKDLRPDITLKGKARTATMVEFVEELQRDSAAVAAEQARLTAAIAGVQSYITDVAAPGVGRLTQSEYNGLEVAVVMSEGMFGRIGSRLKEVGSEEVEDLLSQLQTHRNLIHSGRFEELSETLKTLNYGKSTDHLRALERLSRESRATPNDLELKMGYNLLRDHLKNRQRFVSEINAFVGTQKLMGRTQSVQKQARILGELRGNLRSSYLKEAVDAETRKLKFRYMGEIQKSLGFEGPDAEFIFAWQTRRGADILEAINNRGEDASKLLQLQFEDLASRYALVQSGLLDAVAKGYQNLTGEAVNKAFLHGLFLRSPDPTALVKAFGSDMEEYANIAASAASKFKRQRTPATLMAKTGHTITQEYVLDEATGVSTGSVLGRYQHEAHRAMNKVGEFFNQEDVSSSIKAVDNILYRLKSSEQDTVQDMMKLMDGVQGQRTILFECDVEGSFRPTATGRLFQATARSQDDGRVLRELGDRKLLKEVFEQLHREGRGFRLGGAVRKGEFDTYIANIDTPEFTKDLETFARDFTRWVRSYTDPVRSARPELWDVAEEAYRHVRLIDAATSRKTLADAAEQAERYGRRVDPIAHRSRRAVGQTTDDSLGPLSDYKIKAARGDSYAARMLGRRYSSSDAGQLADAQLRTLQNTIRLTDNFVFDATKRIQDTNISHATGEIVRHIARLDGLGHVEYAKMLREFTDFDLTLNHLTGLANDLYRVATRTERGASALSNARANIAKTGFDVLESVLSPFAFLGRFTKPFKEAWQALYTLTLANPSAYITMQGWRSIGILVSSSLTNTVRSLAAAAQAPIRIAIRSQKSPLDLIPKPSGDALSMRLGQIGNELISEAYLQGSKFLGARRLMRRAQSGAHHKARTLDEGLGVIYRVNSELYTYTKELQEAYSSRAGIRVAESYLKYLNNLHTSGMDISGLFQKARTQYRGGISDARLMQTVTELFGGLEPGGLEARLKTPEGVMAYKNFASLIHDTTIGRFGGSAGGTLSRMAARVAPGLGLFAVPKSQFIDRLLVRPLMASIYTENAFGKTIVPTAIGAAIYLAFKMNLEMFETGAENIGSADAYGRRDLRGRVMDSYADALEYTLTELWETDPQWQAFVTNAIRKGTHIPFTAGDIEPRLFKRWVFGTSDFESALETVIADLLGLGGFDRGISNVFGPGTVGGLYKASSAGVDLFKSTGTLREIEDLQRLATLEWESAEAYQKAVADSVTGILGRLPEGKRNTLAEQIQRNGGRVTQAVQDEMILSFYEEQYANLRELGMTTPLAPYIHILNPGTLALAYRDFIQDPDGIESIEGAADLRRHFGILDTGDINNAERFASRIYGNLVESGVISQKTYEKKIKDFNSIWELEFEEYFTPDVETHNVDRNIRRRPWADRD